MWLLSCSPSWMTTRAGGESPSSHPRTHRTLPPPPSQKSEAWKPPKLADIICGQPLIMLLILQIDKRGRKRSVQRLAIRPKLRQGGIPGFNIITTNKHWYHQHKSSQSS